MGLIHRRKHFRASGLGAYATVLLPMTGADASTTFNDSSANGFNATAVGDAQVDTGINDPFGQADGYLLCDGTGDYLTMGSPDNSKWDVGANDFTLACWVRPVDTTRRAIFSSGGRVPGVYWLNMDYSIDGSNKNFNIWASSTGSSWDILTADDGGNGTGAIALNLNSWNHLAYVRYGTHFMSFVNGTKDLDVTSSATVVFKTAQKRLGAYEYIAAWNGGICDFLFLNGYALYTANFTPPARYSLT